MDELKLTERHLKIPYVIACKFAWSGTDRFDDLVSEGNVALVKALRSFKPGMGASLDTWLYTCTYLPVLRYATHQKGADYQWWLRSRRMDPATEDSLYYEDDPVLEQEETIDEALACLSQRDKKFIVKRILRAKRYCKGGDKKAQLGERQRYHRLITKVREYVGVE